MGVCLSLLTVGLVREFVGEELVEVLKHQSAKQLRMDGRHAVHSMRAHNGLEEEKHTSDMR